MHLLSWLQLKARGQGTPAEKLNLYSEIIKMCVDFGCLPPSSSSPREKGNRNHFPLLQLQRNFPSSQALRLGLCPTAKCHAAFSIPSIPSIPVLNQCLCQMWRHRCYSELQIVWLSLQPCNTCRAQLYPLSPPLSLHHTAHPYPSEARM